MKRTIGFFILVSLLASPAFAEKLAMPSLAMPTAASNGFGGTHVAFTDNVYALFVNPAAIMQTQQRSFFTLAPTFLNPQRTVALGSAFKGLAQGDTGAFGEAADTLSKQNGRIALGMELREFPLSFAWVANGFGFGVWNRTFVNANIIGTYVEVHAYEDVVIPIGFAFKILNLYDHKIDLGLTLKPFARVRAREKEEIIRLMDDSDDFVDKINVPLIMGAGFDLGLLYRWDKGLQMGLTFDDVFTRGKVAKNIIGKDGNTYYVPFTMNLGIAYDFRIERFWESAPSLLSKSGFTLAFDWRDFTNIFNQDDYKNRNSLLDMGAGFQLSLFDIVKVRIGLSEMLPAFGLGFDLGPVEIDLAYYGMEFGNEPGQLSAAAVDLSIAIRPGAKKRNWPWARRSLIGLFTGVETIDVEEVQ